MKNFNFFYLLLLSILLFPTITYSKNGIYQGYEFYNDCKASNNYIKNSLPSFKTVDQYQNYLISAVTCSSSIDSVYDMVVFHTNLIQNKALKNSKNDLTSTDEFQKTHFFCVPKVLSNHDLVQSVFKYMDEKIKFDSQFLAMPAVDIILDSFHENFPCEL